jgi:hypothetical protein
MTYQALQKVIRRVFILSIKVSLLHIKSSINFSRPPLKRQNDAYDSRLVRKYARYEGMNNIVFVTNYHSSVTRTLRTRPKVFTIELH